MTPETKAKLAENLKKARAARARNLKAGKRRKTPTVTGLASQLLARARELEVEARKLTVQARALRRAVKLIG